MTEITKDIANIVQTKTGYDLRLYQEVISSTLGDWQKYYKSIDDWLKTVKQNTNIQINSNQNALDELSQKIKGLRIRKNLIKNVLNS